jgi:GNAT superfamily N-acetyltransferase
VDPAFGFLKPQMLSYAERRLCGVRPDGTRFLDVFGNDFDTRFSAELEARGWVAADKGHRPMSMLAIPRPFPSVELPPGFSLASLAEANDLRRVHRVLWRGFNHPGEPPEQGIEGRRKMQSGPHFRRDLTIVVRAPSGDFASFCGTWLDAVNRIAYVEPVATDPAYRRLGLGRAAVMEGVRRCGELGATAAFVGSAQPFYLALGFRPLFVCRRWVRDWPAAPLDSSLAIG